MKTLGLDGQYHIWNPAQRFGKERSKVSEPHKNARELLKEIYPMTVILEEVPLPIQRGQTLFADFYIASQKLIIEVNGEQHDEFNSFYYKNRTAFTKAKKRDVTKQDWCDLNNLSLIVLDSKESLDEWRAKIRAR